MMALRVDLGKPTAAMPRLALATAAGLTLVAAALVWNGTMIRQRLAADAPRASGATAREHRLAQSEPAYASDLQAWLKVAQAPWGSIVAAIESADMEGVRMVRLEVDALARSITIEVDAHDHAAASSWFAALSRASPGHGWQLQQSRQTGERVVAIGAGGW